MQWASRMCAAQKVWEGGRRRCVWGRGGGGAIISRLLETEQNECEMHNEGNL